MTLSPRMQLILDTWRRFVANRGAVVGLSFIALITCAAIFAPWVSTHNPGSQDIMRSLEGPGPDHILGTDELGRDVFSRVVHGGRLSLAVGLSALSFGAVLGVSLGLVAGFYGGMVENLIMRVVDLLMAFPGVLLAILVVAMLGSGMVNLVIAIGISMTPRFARLTHGTVLTLREQEYVEAARALGVGNLRIMVRHILMNTLSPLIVYATLSIPTAILQAAALSFLGIGLQAGDAEWGAMVSSARPYLRSAPHMALFPGFAIFLTTLSFNFVGDALRDALDPKLKV